MFLLNSTNYMLILMRGGGITFFLRAYSYRCNLSLSISLGYECILEFLFLRCLPNFLMAFLRLGMYREAEKQFKSALKQQEMVDTFLYLAKVSVPNPSRICLLRTV